MIGRGARHGVVLGVCLWLLAPAPAAAEDCAPPSDVDYDIDLEIETPPARLQHDLGVAELGRMALHGPRGQVLGLTDTGLDFGWRVRFEWRPQGQAYCFWVRRTELTIRLSSPDIYVAREYRRGSCPYRVILAHEQQHVEFSRALIGRYVPRLRWVLTSLRIPTVQRPVLVESPEAARAEVEALMKDLTEPLFDEMAQALREAQARIDTPASYASLRRRCRSW